MVVGNVTYQVARDVHTGGLVWVHDCRSPKPRSLVCLDNDCRGAVFPRRGHRNAWHFCHYSNGSRCGRMATGIGKGESQEHIVCKNFLAAKNSRIAYANRRCYSCGNTGCAMPLSWSLHTSVEKRIIIGGKEFVLDVGLVSSNGSVVGAIEVLHTHEVGYEKRSLLEGGGIAVLEVTTDEAYKGMQRLLSKAVSKDSLVVLETTCIDKSRLCNECDFLMEWNATEIVKPIEVERGYVSLCQSYLGDILAKQAIHRHRMEEMELKRSFKRRRTENMVCATERLQNPLFKEGDAYVKGTSFKCIGCRRWRRWVACQIEYNDLCPFKEFCREGLGSSRHVYDNCRGKACTLCGSTCSHCGDWTTIQQVSMYGFCFVCNRDAKQHQQ